MAYSVVVYDTCSPICPHCHSMIGDDVKWVEFVKYTCSACGKYFEIAIDKKYTTFEREKD